jgi:hypothetical protein
MGTLQTDMRPSLVLIGHSDDRFESTNDSRFAGEPRAVSNGLGSVSTTPLILEKNEGEKRAWRPIEGATGWDAVPDRGDSRCLCVLGSGLRRFYACGVHSGRPKDHASDQN